MRHYLYTLLLTTLTLITPLTAQTPHILTGQITDQTGRPMRGVNIILCDKTNKKLHYTITTTNGHYQLNHHPRGAYIKYSFLGYTPVTIPYNPSQTTIPPIQMQETSIHLDEVAVKPQRITQHGDTLTYSVANFKHIHDRSIADVIKKMPGLKIRPNGAIEYQGKAINKFYIEGLDMMGSQYKIASNNIKADKVQSVQVLENHQAIKSLRGIKYSEQAALNIILKDEAKNIWATLLETTPGINTQTTKPLYQNKLMGMNFKKTNQTLLLYKNTNTGTNLSEEVHTLATLSEYHGESNILHLPSLPSPPFSDERHTFHKTHLLSTNRLWKTSKDTQLRIQLSALTDSEDQQTHTHTTYLNLPDTPQIKENRKIHNKQKEGRGELTYTLNTHNTYLRTTTKAYTDRSHAAGTLNYDNRPAQLMVRPHRHYLSEDLTLSHTLPTGNILTFKTSTGTTHMPGRLLTIDNHTQHLNIHKLTTTNHLTYKQRLGRTNIDNTLTYHHQRQTINQTRWHIHQASWTPSVKLNLRPHELTATAKISHVSQTLRHNPATPTTHTHTIWAEPSLSWRWKISPTSQLMTRYRLGHQPFDAATLTIQPTFTTHATLTTGLDTPAATHTHTLTNVYTYRNPVSGIFLNIRPTYHNKQGNILYDTQLHKGIYKIKATPRRYTTNTYMLSTRIAKNLFLASTTIGLELTASSTQTQMLARGTLIKNHMRHYHLSLDYSLKPTLHTSIEGLSSLNIHRRSQNNGPATSTHHWTHKLAINYAPHNKWNISLTDELYHSNTKACGLNNFCDIAISHKTPRCEITLRANNLAGTTEYKQETISTAIRQYTITQLRPREILLQLSIDI